MTSRLWLGLAASLLLLAAGCKDPDGSSGGTSGAALYTFDSTSNQVFVWKDLGAVYDSTTTPSPTYQITSSLFSKVSNLAWGGLAFDRQRGILYMVSDTGTIVRVNNIRSQSGSVPTGDVYSFSLSSTGRLTNGKFGQIALDTQNDTLFITESGDSSTQIWVVASASSQIQDASIALQALQMSGDSGGTGVAAGSGVVYAFFKDGGTVGTDALTGPRLRKGSSVSFDASQVILGKLTTLGIYGSLALDTGNNYLFVARHNTDAASTDAPIQAFRTGQFGLSYNQAPSLTVGTAAGQPDLRVLSHPGTKDWLVGLRGNGTTGYNTILIWKSPLGGTAAKTATAASGSVFKGLAVDGNAS
ncbi:MAG: hypothetical protein HY014_11470 [Acidobacteria bacterium]|nr:hypothetical protein [Acidobacteriota bacterium]MBI3488773.1 hypothetical protein [Acidobacteriota bacterium]